MSDWLPLLEPPPGGLARLRAQLAERPRRPRWLWAVAPALAVLALVVALRVPPRNPAPVTAITGDPHPPLLVRLPSSNSRVILYAVAPTEGLSVRAEAP